MKQTTEPHINKSTNTNKPIIEVGVCSMTIDKKVGVCIVLDGQSEYSRDYDNLMLESIGTHFRRMRNYDFLFAFVMKYRIFCFSCWNLKHNTSAYFILECCYEYTTVVEVRYNGNTDTVDIRKLSARDLFADPFGCIAIDQQMIDDFIPKMHVDKEIEGMSFERLKEDLDKSLQVLIEARLSIKW